MRGEPAVLTRTHPPSPGAAGDVGGAAPRYHGHGESREQPVRTRALTKVPVQGPFTPEP